MLIREAVWIHTKAQFDAYIKSMEIKGLSGTDFRPVFQYIDEELEKKTISKMAGLLYFTDGDGIYPKKKPSYKTAFLFPDQDKDINVPPWAIKYHLKGDRDAYSTSENTD